MQNAKCKMASLLNSAFCILHSAFCIRIMKRLLIVEDKESLALMLRETVAAEGLEADIASNGSEAMNRLATGTPYFAVLTDLRLPGADGIAVLRHGAEGG